jgi:anhydro-N-acetylmuramic acid kinase
VLVTGGGAHHDFFIEQLRAHGLTIHLPDPQTIDQKEALIFGFLGLLRYLRRPNVLKEVTGSGADHTAGSLIELFP